MPKFYWRFSGICLGSVLFCFIFIFGSNYRRTYFTVPASSYLDECKTFWQERNCSADFQGRRRDSWSTTNFHSSNGQPLLDFRRVLLVVYFNMPHFESAAKLEALYGRNFAEIVYCGFTPRETFWPLNPATRFSAPMFALPRYARYVSYAAPTKDAGQVAYDCLARSLDEIGPQLSQQLDGALVIADDVIVNLWTLSKNGKSLTKNWILAMNTNRVFDIDTGFSCDGVNNFNNSEDCTSDTWVWSRKYANETKAFFADLEKASLMEPFGGSTAYWSWVLERLESTTKGRRRAFGEASADIFYVSQRNFAITIPLLKLFAKHQVFVEIAVVTALRALTPVEHLQTIDTQAHDWGDGTVRNHPIIDAYSTDLEMLHPFKLSAALADSPRVDPSHYMRDLLQRAFNNENITRHISDSSASCVYCNLIFLFDNYSKQSRQKK